jgi:hypothetical protein
MNVMMSVTAFHMYDAAPLLFDMWLWVLIDIWSMLHFEQNIYSITISFWHILLLGWIGLLNWWCKLIFKENWHWKGSRAFENVPSILNLSLITPENILRIGFYNIYADYSWRCLEFEKIMYSLTMLFMSLIQSVIFPASELHAPMRGVVL